MRSTLLRVFESGMGENLREVWLFGSAARGDMWAAHMPMPSDIDLLVLTDTALSENAPEDLVNEIYPLFLESGRQLSPAFHTVAEFNSPPSQHRRAFFENVTRDGRLLIA